MEDKVYVATLERDPDKLWAPGTELTSTFTIVARNRAHALEIAHHHIDKRDGKITVRQYR